MADLGQKLGSKGVFSQGHFIFTWLLVHIRPTAVQAKLVVEAL